LAGILRVEHADKDPDGATLRQSLFHQFPGLPTCGDVVGADVTSSVAVGRVAVLRKDKRLAGDAVEQLRLVLWINRADRHAVNAFGNEVFDDALLPGSRAITGHLELDCYIGQFGGSLLCPLARNRPEVRRVVGDKGQPQFLVATFFASVASGNAESQADDQCAGQTTTKPCSHKNVPPDLEFGIRDGRDCKQTSAKSNLSALTSCVNKQKGCSAFDRIPVLIRSEVRDKDLSLLLLSEHE